MAKKKTGLGKGAAALFGDLGDILSNNDPISNKDIKDEDKQEILGSVLEIPIEKIEVNPFQPRTEFDPNKLNELRQSIEIHGVVQPITVRSMGDQSFQLISGERRLRASKKAGLTTIPAYVRLADDQEMLEIALIENIQREDLNAIEIGLNYKRLLEECSLTHEDLGKRLGINRTSVTNYIRLLNLPPEIQLALKSKKISMGHARSLVGIEDLGTQLTIFKQVVAGGLSVRKTEELIKSFKGEDKDDKKSKTTANTLPTAYRQVQDELSERFETKVQLKVNKGKGNISIPFHSEEDLNRLLELLYNE